MRWVVRTLQIWICELGKEYFGPNWTKLLYFLRRQTKLPWAVSETSSHFHCILSYLSSVSTRKLEALTSLFFSLQLKGNLRLITSHWWLIIHLSSSSSRFALNRNPFSLFLSLFINKKKYENIMFKGVQF